MRFALQSSHAEKLCYANEIFSCKLGLYIALHVKKSQKAAETQTVAISLWPNGLLHTIQLSNALSGVFNVQRHL